MHMWWNVLGINMERNKRCTLLSEPCTAHFSLPCLLTKPCPSDIDKHLSDPLSAFSPPDRCTAPGLSACSHQEMFQHPSISAPSAGLSSSSQSALNWEPSAGCSAPAAPPRAEQRGQNLPALLATLCAMPCIGSHQSSWQSGHTVSLLATRTPRPFSTEHAHVCTCAPTGMWHPASPLSPVGQQRLIVTSRAGRIPVSFSLPDCCPLLPGGFSSAMWVPVAPSHGSAARTHPHVGVIQRVPCPHDGLLRDPRVAVGLDLQHCHLGKEERGCVCRQPSPGSVLGAHFSIPSAAQATPTAPQPPRSSTICPCPTCSPSLGVPQPVEAEPKQQWMLCRTQK